MQFDYLDSTLSRSFTLSLKNRFDAAFAEEVRARAQLLCNLGWSLEEARSRIKAGVAWEFDGSWNRSAPRLLKAVDEQTQAIYNRNGKAPIKAAPKATPKAPAKKPTKKK